MGCYYLESQMNPGPAVLATRRNPPQLPGKPLLPRRRVGLVHPPHLFADGAGALDPLDVAVGEGIAGAVVVAHIVQHNILIPFIQVHIIVGNLRQLVPGFELRIFRA